MKGILLKKRSKKGFTLVELVIVVAVLVIIAGIAIPTVHNVIGNANKAADTSNAQTVELALKTAVAEIESKNNSTSLNMSSTVGEVLAENGIGKQKAASGTTTADLPELKSGGEWKYDVKTGKIYAVGAPSTAKELKNTTTLAEIFE